MPPTLTVAQAGTTTHLVTISPGATLRQALLQLLRCNIGRLPVVDPANPLKIVGYIGRGEILAAQSQTASADDPTRREPGWLAGLRARRS